MNCRLLAYTRQLFLWVQQRAACQMRRTYRLLQQRRVVPQTSASPFSPACPSTAQVGGGPTGVELAAELHDLVKEDIARLQPQLRVGGLSGAGMLGGWGGCFGLVEQGSGLRTMLVAEACTRSMAGCPLNNGAGRGEHHDCGFAPVS